MGTTTLGVGHSLYGLGGLGGSGFDGTAIDTLSELNANFADGTVLDTSSATRTPSAHTHTLSDISDAGTAAAAATGDFATAAQGALADTAVQPGDLGTAAAAATGDFATAAQGANADAALQPDDVSTVATTGLYNDLSGLPTLARQNIASVNLGSNAGMFNAAASYFSARPISGGAFIKLSSLANDSYIFNQHNDLPGNYPAMYIRVDTDGYVIFSQNSNYIKTDAVLISTDTWYHVGFSWHADGATAIYINGVQVKTGTSTSNVSTNYTRWGAKTNGDSQFLGLLAYPFIYVGDATESNFADLYNGSLPSEVFSSNLTSYESASDGSTWVATTGTNTLTANGTVTPSSDAPTIMESIQIKGVMDTVLAQYGHTHTLSDITDAGTAAAAATGDFATAAQGALADTAVQPGDLGTAAALDTGTSAGNVVVLDGSAKLPSIDGSQLTGITGGTGGTVQDGTTRAIQPTYEGSTAGDARGNNAVDLQTVRLSANQVASGQNSVIGGGESNLASGVSSTVNGGYQNTASGLYSTVIGGSRAIASLQGQVSFGSGYLSTRGDCQRSILHFRKITTDATPVNLFLDGASEKLTVASNFTWSFTGLITARRTDTTDQAAYKIEGMITNEAGTTTVQGITVTPIYESDSAWDVTITADDTNDALDIKVTGAAAKTIRWGGYIDIMMVGG